MTQGSCGLIADHSCCRSGLWSHELLIHGLDRVSAHGLVRPVAGPSTVGVQRIEGRVHAVPQSANSFMSTIERVRYASPQCRPLRVWRVMARVGMRLGVRLGMGPCARRDRAQGCVVLGNRMRCGVLAAYGHALATRHAMRRTRRTHEAMSTAGEAMPTAGEAMSTAGEAVTAAAIPGASMSASKPSSTVAPTATKPSSVASTAATPASATPAAVAASPTTTSATTPTSAPSATPTSARVLRERRCSGCEQQCENNSEDASGRCGLHGNLQALYECSMDDA